MAVYVDNKRIAYCQMLMCHMVADTPQELHEMAERLELKFKWFKPESFPHYDICQSKRKLAIKYGAQEISNKELVALIRKSREEEG